MQHIMVQQGGSIVPRWVPNHVAGLSHFGIGGVGSLGVGGMGGLNYGALAGGVGVPGLAAGLGVTVQDMPRQRVAAVALAAMGGGQQSAPKAKKEPKEPKPVKPKMPKAPKSAYLCFEQERRRELVEGVVESEGAGATVGVGHGVGVVMGLPDSNGVVRPAPRNRDHGDISREVGRQWKSLSAEQRKKWQQASEKDQERYSDECAAMLRQRTQAARLADWPWIAEAWGCSEPASATARASLVPPGGESGR